MAWGTVRLARLMAACAITLQMLLQGAIGLGPSHGFDVTRLYCASPELQRSSEVTAALQELAVLVGLEPPADEAEPDHCPLCILAHGAPLQGQPLLVLPAIITLRTQPVLFEPAFHALAQGPPLGSRAPPALT